MRPAAAGARLPRMSRSAIGVLVGVLALGGCGDDEAKRSASTPATTPVATVTPASTPASTPTPTPTPTGIDTMAGADTAPVVVPATNRQTALLTGVRAARHEGFDRVVFEFAGAVPGYDVRYVQRPLHQDGSGKVITVAGEYVVQVRMENALDADLSKPSAPLTYTGPMRLSPRTPEIAELARTGGFEGVLTWVVGVRDHVDFRVSTLDGPPRLVVDFRNH